MDILQGPAVALAEVALVPGSEFSPRSTIVVARLKALLNAVRKVASEFPQRFTAALADQVYLPLHYLLQKDELGDQQSEVLLRILAALFAGPWQDGLTFEKAQQFISITTYILSPDPPGTNTQFLRKSSELRAAGFSCLDSIFHACVSSGIASRIGTSPALAHLVTLSLDALQADESLEAQLAVFACLNTLLFQIIRDPNKLALLLPGVSSKLVNFYGHKYGRKHVKVRVEAVRLYGKLLCLCLGDSSLQVASDVRTDAWIKASAHQINLTLDVLYQTLVKSDQPPLLTAICEFIQDVARDCTDTLSICLPSLSDMLLFCASQKDVKSISDQALNALQKLSVNTSFEKSLEERLLDLIRGLPRKFMSADPTDPNLSLSALSIGLKYTTSLPLIDTLLSSVDEALVIEQAPQSFNSENAITRVGRAEVVTELEVGKMHLDTRITLSDLGIKIQLSDTTQIALYDLFASIGRSSYGGPLLQQVYERLQDTKPAQFLTRTHLLWIASGVFAGFMQVSSADSQLSYDYLDTSFSVIDLAGSLSSAENPYLVTMSLFMLGQVCTSLGPEIKGLLIDILNPVLDMLGSGSTAVVVQAKNTLRKIAFACGYSDVKDLILQNKDYIVDGISQRLNTLDFSPQTLEMLTILIMVAGPTMVNYLEDLISSLFVILDNYQGYSSLVSSIFAAFSAIVRVVSTHKFRALEDRPDKEDQDRDPASHISTFEQLIEELHRPPKVDPIVQEHAENAKLDDFTEKSEKESTADSDGDVPIESDIDESDKDDIDAPMQDADEWTSPIPQATYKIIDKILDTADRFLTHGSAQLRYNLLGLISLSVPILATHEKTFLPQVHKLWGVLSDRIFDAEIFVAEAAFHTIAEICIYAGDFTGSRMDKLWGRIVKAQKKGLFNRAWPAHSPEQRYIAALSDCFAVDIKHASVDTFDNILECMVPVFRRGESRSLKQALEAKNSDMVWLLMLNKEDTPNPIYPEFFPVNPIQLST